MPISPNNAQPIIPKNQSSGGSLKDAANVLRYEGSRRKDADLWAAIAKALDSGGNQIDFVWNALRSPVMLPDPIQITNQDGSLIAQIGHMLGSNNRSYSGIWGNNVYIGGSGPDTAQFVSNGASTQLNNATIMLTGTGGTITLDPTGPFITSIDTSGNFVSLTGSTISIAASIGTPQANLSFDQINLHNSSAVVVALISSNTGGTEAGTINLKNSNATKSVQLDPSATSAVTTTGGGNVNTSGVFSVSGVPGISATRNRYTSISVSTRGDGVVGTPGVGQSNVTVVTAVTLSVIGEGISGGIITS